MNPEQEKLVRDLVAAAEDDVRLQALVDGYDDDYDAFAIPLATIAACADARAKMIQTARVAVPALSALLAERDAMQGVLEMARAKIVTGGAGGWATTLAAINDVLEPEEAEDGKA